MDFEQVLDALLEGKRVKRLAFDDYINFIQFKTNEEGKKTLRMFCIATDLYLLQGDIITSSDWLIHDIEGKHNFISMIKYLFEGRLAYLEEWGDDKWIRLAQSRKEIMVNYYIDRVFTLNPEDILATDWIIVE